MAYSYDRTAATKTAGETWKRLNEEYQNLLEEGDAKALAQEEAKTVREYTAAVRSLETIIRELKATKDKLQDATLPDAILPSVWPVQQGATDHLWRTIKGFEDTLRLAHRVAYESEAWFGETLQKMDPAMVLFHWPNLLRFRPMHWVDFQAQCISDLSAERGPALAPEAGRDSFLVVDLDEEAYPIDGEPVRAAVGDVHPNAFSVGPNFEGATFLNDHGRL